MKSVVYMTTNPVDAEIINEQVMILVGGSTKAANFVKDIMNEKYKKHIVKIEFSTDNNPDECKLLVLHRLENYVTEIGPGIDMADTEAHDEDYS